MSLGLATHVGFWDAGPGAIGEDMHMFCKALFDTHGHVRFFTISFTSSILLRCHTDALRRPPIMGPAAFYGYLHVSKGLK
jgi:hypothetical protein